MKTFSTSGTGNQQTLSEIESDKMPIYDSLTDVEADLANLEVGQIVATKDTGSELSAPVDTVQSGNMHAVTSNAVAKGLSYSMTEQKTGGTWIDGKPIYRKCYDAGSFVSNIDWDITSLNIDVLINAQVIGCNSADGTSTRWTMSLASGFDSRQAYLSLGHFITTGDYYKRYAIIEYTKTTD